MNHLFNFLDYIKKRINNHLIEKFTNLSLYVIRLVQLIKLMEVTIIFKVFN